MRVKIDEILSFLVRYKRHSRSDADKKKEMEGFCLRRIECDFIYLFIIIVF